jgi:hypothetical protein
MFFKKQRELERRIAALEADVTFNRDSIHCLNKAVLIETYSDSKTKVLENIFSVKTAIKAILNHLNVGLKETPGKVELVPIKDSANEPR